MFFVWGDSCVVLSFENIIVEYSETTKAVGLHKEHYTICAVEKVLKAFYDFYYSHNIYLY